MNYSIGGSPSPFVLYQLIKYRKELENCSYIFIEPTVIDHGEGWQNADEIFFYANSVMKYLKFSSGKVFLLALPRYEHHLLSIGPGMVAWLEAARMNSIVSINGSAVLNYFINKRSIDMGSCWKDNSGHFIDEVQNELAITCLNLVKADLPMQTYNKAISLDFHVLNWLDFSLNQEDVIARENSLISIESIRLDYNRTIHFPKKSGFRVHGISINYGCFNGSIPTFISFEASGVVDDLNIQNEFLGVGSATSLLLMFRRCNISLNTDVKMFLSNKNNSERFDESGLESLEFVDVLIGPDIKLSSNWQKENLDINQVIIS